MALDPVYCRGARGDVIVALQRALQSQKVPNESDGSPEPALAKVDGNFGIAMQRAVQRVQRANQLLMTGAVDAATWKFLMGVQPWPATFERLLFVLAGFEDHFYSKATGDRENDRVGMTWGLLGYTLVQPDGVEGYRKGPLSALLRNLYQQHRDLLVDAFGEPRATQLEDALKLDPPELHKFAVDHLSSVDGATLQAPWREGFTKLGELEVVRQAQRDYANDYYMRAQALATEFGTAYRMDCERTLLYFFDLTVNNGGFFPNEKTNAKAAIQNLIATNPNASVAQKLQRITEVLAASRPKYAKDLRERKGTLAYGYGYVHGRFYRMEGWAIDVAEPAAPVPAQDPPRLAVFGLDDQRVEQLALARETHKLAVEEEAAAASLFEGRFPQQTGYELISSGGTRSVSLRRLVKEGAGRINSNFTEHYEAAQMLFRGHTGVLVISGQITRPLSMARTADHYVLQRTQRTYAGLVLRSNDQLMLIRQRRSGTAVNETMVDITDLRRSLGGCGLIMLYSGYGVPVSTLPGSGPRWREWVAQTGATPLVLGWFGNVRPPQDSQKLSLANEFFGRVRQLKPGDDLLTICRERSQQVIEQWGIACHAAFAASSQKYLWLDEPIPGLKLMASGAAAIDPSGQAWRANPGYTKPGQPAMTRE